MKKYKLNVVLALFVALTNISVYAQKVNHSVIFRAMEDELLRNKEELKLSGYESPFFLSYTLKATSSYEIAATLGAITNSVSQLDNVIGSVRLMIGNYHRTNDFSYDGGLGIRALLPLDGDYDEIRRNFWLATDKAYKIALQQYASKKAYLQSKPKSMEEEAMDDFSKQSVGKEVVVEEMKQKLDQQLYENRLKKLSAIFKRYPQLQSSMVILSGVSSYVYKVSSEGLKMRIPIGQSTIAVSASVLSSDGERISDNWTYTVSSINDFPSEVELEKQITEFADNLISLSQAPPMEEYYAGPILFENSACVSIFMDNLLRSGQLLAWRKPEGKPDRLTLDGRIDRKILDSRLSVKNYSTLKMYNEVPLLGYYEVDAEGIVPPKELSLIEDGILKRQLNGRIPTLKAPLSTGSSRFSLAASQVYFATAPGTLHIVGEEGFKMEKMKKALIKAAVEENLKYAYIVRKIAGKATLMYRVDVKTGEEVQVRAGDFIGINLMKLKRLRELSAKEQVVNYLLGGQCPSSIICPQAILLEDIEVNVPKVQKERKNVLTFPLER